MSARRNRKRVTDAGETSQDDPRSYAVDVEEPVPSGPRAGVAVCPHTHVRERGAEKA